MAEKVSLCSKSVVGAKNADGQSVILTILPE